LINPRLCLVLKESVPGDAPILPLNAWSSLYPCQFSPLLPRNKLVHFYESVLSPDFKKLLYGRASEQIQIYQEKRINFFYVRKGDISFYGPAFGESFSADNLATKFDLFWENDDSYIMTWRGQGIRPLTQEETTQLDQWRKASFNAPMYFNHAGAKAYQRLKERIGSGSE
jgi:hypothetical protein